MFIHVLCCGDGLWVTSNRRRNAIHESILVTHSVRIQHPLHEIYAILWISMVQRTTAQNRALHKFFSLLSDKLNEQGLEMQVVLKQGTSIWWTPENVKNYLWRPLQDAMLGKMSTKELDKQMDIDRVHEQLMHILGEKHHVEFIDFPHNKDTIPNYGVYIEPDPDKNVLS